MDALDPLPPHGVYLAVDPRPDRGKFALELVKHDRAVLYHVLHGLPFDGAVVGLLPSASGVERRLVQRDETAIEGLQDRGVEREEVDILVVEETRVRKALRVELR